MDIKNDHVFHLGVNKASLKGAKIAILPGDPARAEKISSKLNNPSFLNHSREFCVYSGFIDNTPVIVCSTGIGGPSTSIVVEELATLGVNTFLRVGTTGAIQPHISIGDVIITTASIRLDGASKHYAPLEYPAVSDFYILKAMEEATKELNINCHMGITASSDTFYPGQERYDTFSGYIIKDYVGSMEQWKNLRALNYEMESATLLTMCSSLGLRAGCLSGVLVNRNNDEIPSKDMLNNVEEQTINAIIKSTKNYLKMNLE